MNRIILLALALILLSLGARLVFSHFVSEETKIRWLVEDMVEGFNAGKARQSVRGLDSNWSHAERPLDRDMLRGFILGEAMQGGLGSRRAFPWRVELPPDSLRIQVAEDEDSAALEAELLFSHNRSGTEEPADWELQWHLRLLAELHPTDEGWRILKSRHEDIQGALIGR